MRLIVNGCAGRMGRTLIRLIDEHDALHLAGGLEAKGSYALGQDLGVLAGGGKLGLSASDDALALMAEADGVIDFTTPEASLELAGLAAQARSVHIIGTTGFDTPQEAAIAAAARHARIVKSGNMSLGVNVLAGLVKQAAAQLAMSGISKFWICIIVIRSMPPQARLCCWAQRRLTDAALTLTTLAKAAEMVLVRRAPTAPLVLRLCAGARWLAIMRLFWPVKTSKSA